MQTYHVMRDFPQNGHIHRKGHTIELSERQARYLLINGFVEKADRVSNATSKPQKKKAAVKEKSVKKSAARKSK